MSLARAGFIAALCLCLTLTQHVPAQGQAGPLEITMVELVDDTWGNRVVARGNVEVRFFGEILLADEIIYDRRARKLSARGNITLQEADGKVSRADAMNLHDDLRDAFVSYARRQKLRVDR